jgi:pilus assembly protein Flp/PilA
MRKHCEIFRRFAQDESGLSAVEYGLLAAGIAVAIYSIIADVGNSLHAIFSSVNTDLQPPSGS